MAFVTKLNPAGTGLMYSTYLGGSAYDNALAIAVDSSGDAYLTGSVKTGVFHDPSDPGTVSAFSTQSAAQSQFVEPLPGQAGERNILRGDGYFSTDLSLSKRWLITEKHSLQLRWEVFNVSNSVRFDVQSLNSSIDSFGSTFGQYTRLSTNPRVMQFALRYEF